MRQTKLTVPGVAALLAATVTLSACSCGSETGDEGLTNDEARFREASKILATLISEQDAEGFCSFLDAEGEGTFVRAVGTQYCLGTAESRLSAITEDERCSWASADFSEVETRQDPDRAGNVDPHKFCWERGADVPVADGAWAPARSAGTFPCLRHNGEKWIVLSTSTWLMDF